MQTISADIFKQFTAVMNKRAVPVQLRPDYLKWLRYFLDFRSKYPLPDLKSEQVRLFILKLKDKKQTPEQQKEAAYVLSLFFESQRTETKAATIAPIHSIPPPSAGKHYNDWNCFKKSASYVRTTMIYTHCIPSKTVKEAKSPLDF
jgi:hypothetical protein